MLFKKEILKNSIYPDEPVANKITLFHLALFLISLPFDSIYSRIILISLVIHTALHLTRRSITKLWDKSVLILVSLYFLSVLAAMYTLDWEEAAFDLTKELGILLFPIIFSVTDLDIGAHRTLLLYAFSITCVFTVGFLYVDALKTILYFKLPLSSLFTDLFLNHNFSQPIDLHATYFSMYVGLSLFFVIHQAVRTMETYKRLLLLVAALILFAAVLQLASRSNFIAVLLSICFVLPLMILHGRTRILSIACCAAIFGLLIGGIFLVPSLKERYVTELRADLSVNSGNGGRSVRWAAISELIMHRPLIGYGTGSETGVLKAKYLQKGLMTAYNLGLNTHNQYLGYLFRAGILGLIVYLFTLGFGFYTAFRNRDPVFMGFLVMVTIVSVSENILDVNKGIFFYSFYFSFFYFSGNSPLYVKG